MLDKGVLIYNVSTNVSYKVVSVEKTQYNCNVKIKGLVGKRVYRRKESDLDNYKYSESGEWVVERTNPRNYNWMTDEETKFLIDNYPTMQYDELCERLGRTKKNISTIAANLRKKGIHVDFRKAV